MSPRAVIFDMDGTLLATEILCRRAWQQAAREFGKTLSDAQYNEKLLGRSNAIALGIMGELWGTAVDPEVYVRRADALYAEIIATEGIALREGIFELLTLIREKELPLAVATSTRRELALKKLSLAGLADFFDIIVGGDEVTHGKPHPEIFLHTAEKLKIPPDQCLVFEDSHPGLSAAHTAGMKCILIPDLAIPHPESAKTAWRILRSAVDAIALFRSAS